MRKNKLREVVCEQCGKTTLKGRTGGKRFCNRSCSNIWSHANGGRNVEGIRNLTNSLEGFQQKHGKEAGKKKYDLFVEKMSLVTSGKNNPMYGKQRPEFAAFCRTMKGINYIDRYGPEKAAAIIAKQSAASSGDNNPMFGKPAPKLSGKGVKGYYKGVFFRSLLELVCMKHFESIGISMEEMQHECLRIPYIGFNKQKRTYVPDILIERLKLLVEVKPVKLVNSKTNRMKFEAADKYCLDNNLTFLIFTEDSTTITRDMVVNDKHVKLLEKNNAS